MTVAEKIHTEAMDHLEKARQAMKKLAACTSDWSAGTMVEIEFDSLEETCHEFGRCQFGMNIISRVANHPARASGPPRLCNQHCGRHNGSISYTRLMSMAQVWLQRLWAGTRAAVSLDNAAAASAAFRRIPRALLEYQP